MNWIHELLTKCKRGIWPVSAHPHAVMRQGQRHIDERHMELVVRRGRIVEHKCRPPRKLCLEYYDGKTRTTYGAYVVAHETYFEIMTVYKKRGRR